MHLIDTSHDVIMYQPDVTGPSEPLLIHFLEHSQNTRLINTQ